MEDFVIRMRNEAEELREKLNKLSTFTFSDKWTSLNEEEKQMLEHQRQAMFEYYNALNRRLIYYSSRENVSTTEDF